MMTSGHKQAMPASSVGIPELVVPAGNLSKLRMALAYGADAVYVGAAGLSMRPDSASFTVDRLAHAAQLVHNAGRRLSYAGDPDGDSQTDLFIGAFRESTHGALTGAGYLVLADSL